LKAIGAGNKDNGRAALRICPIREFQAGRAETSVEQEKLILGAAGSYRGRQGRKVLAKSSLDSEKDANTGTIFGRFDH